MKGYTGEGFLSQGRKLGGRRVPLSEMNRQARANAAEKRTALNKDAGGRRLGGTTVTRGADMRKVIADAATRRTTITQGCASGTRDGQKLAEQASKNGFKTQAEEDDANDRAIAQALMELMEEEEGRRLDEAATGSRPSGGLGWSAETGLYVGDDDDEIVDMGSQQVQKHPTGLTTHSDIENPSGRQNSASPAPTGRPVSRLVAEAEANAVKKRDRTGTPVHQPQDIPSARSGSLSSLPAPDLVQTQSAAARSDSENWVCPVCTLENPMQYLCCDACGLERPSSGIDNHSLPVVGSGDAAGIGDSTLDGPTWANAGQSGEARPSTRSSSIGWTCRTCGNFMETKWWTCARCGTMKVSS